MNVNQLTDLGGDGREPRFVFIWVWGLARFVADAEFFVDERHQHVRREFGKAADVPLDTGPLASLTDP